MKWLKNFAAICIFIAVVAAWASIQRSSVRERIAADAHDRRLHALEDVRSGAHAATIMDVKLLPLLAGDATCQRNLTQLTFSMVDVPADFAPSVAELSNLRGLNFYDTSGADNVLAYARDLPISELGFTTTPLSNSSVLGLASFRSLERLTFNQLLPREQLAILDGFPDTIHVHVHPENSLSRHNGG